MKQLLIPILLLQTLTCVSSVTVDLTLERNAATGLWTAGGGDYRDMETGGGSYLPAPIGSKIPLDYVNVTFTKLVVTVPSVVGKECQGMLSVWFPKMDNGRIVKEEVVPSCVGNKFSVVGIQGSWKNPKFFGKKINPLSIKYVVGGDGVVSVSISKHELKGSDSPNPSTILKGWINVNGINPGLAKVSVRALVKTNDIMLFMDVVEFVTSVKSNLLKKQSLKSTGQDFKWKPKHATVTELSSVEASEFGYPVKYAYVETTYKRVFPGAETTPAPQKVSGNPTVPPKSGWISSSTASSTKKPVMVPPSTQMSTPIPTTTPSSQKTVQEFVVKIQYESDLTTPTTSKPVMPQPGFVNPIPVVTEATIIRATTPTTTTQIPVPATQPTASAPAAAPVVVVVIKAKDLTTTTTTTTTTPTPKVNVKGQTGVVYRDGIVHYPRTNTRFIVVHTHTGKSGNGSVVVEPLLLLVQLLIVAYNFL